MRYPLFYHIEKASGTTVHDIFRNELLFYVVLKPFKDDQIGALYDGDGIKMLSRFLPKIEGFGGHSIKPYSVYEPESQYQKVTFIREPVARYLSHYFHQKEVMGIDWTIDSFLEDDRYSNFMTKRIAGFNDVGVAKSVLLDFDFVGLVERFDESLLLMRERFDCLSGVNYESRNIRSDRQSINESFPEDVIAKIKAANSSDIEVYEYVRETLFPGYLESYSGDVELELEGFRASNNSYSPSAFRRFFWRAYEYGYLRGLQRLVMRRLPF